MQTAALPQMIFSFFSPNLPTWTIFPGIWINFSAGLAVWLSLAKRLEGELSLTSLESVDVCLYTYATAIATGLLLCTLGVLLTPAKSFSWDSIWDSDHLAAADEGEVEAIKQDTQFSSANLKKWLIVAAVASGIIFAVFMLIWPLSLYRDYIFTKAFFSGWIGVSGAWAFLAFGLVGIYPLWEGRFVFLKLFQATWALLTGRGFQTQTQQAQGTAHEKQPETPGGSSTDGDSTPNESINGSKQKIDAGGAVETAELSRR